MGKWVNHAMSAHDIYQYFATGRGTGSLDDGQAATRTEWDLEADRAQMIRKQGELIRSGWQGAAAEGAFGAAQPLAESALRGAVLLSRAEDLLDRQSGSFHRAANSVTPVPETPPEMDMNDPMVVFTDHDAEVTAYQADAHHNMEVYRGYDGASEYNQTNMPAEYSTVNHSGGNISVVSGDGRPTGSGGDYIEVPEREQPGNRSESGPYGGPGGPGGAPVSGPTVSGPPPNPSLPQHTSPSTFTPPPPGQLPPTTFPPVPPPTPGPGQPGFVPTLPVGGVTTGSPGGGPGARGGSGYGGGPGARGGYGGGGPGGNAGPGARQGVLPGPGAGAVAAEEAAARRAAAAAATARGGAPGAMGGAPLGGGRGKGDEDKEHQRKVLIETDGESLFGSDVLTAPQVIGDDEYEDD
ncbi:hypothetical protein [Actinophytocola algeriensis]|uniref:PPE family protein n=1 Tax=Actinophytocola algeriensis TaxID=1768010 RepID=A0A7W7VCP6_9PSEU|nr:hypothetical protein [Actinophytocola algeriensis]MBB4905413.1 hypothetical protein [Actinophytocola algeriensis]MBE1472902.1 hypothetical protein [Actinophytocola algeriensis]